jgi:hypothetical protein
MRAAARDAGNRSMRRAGRNAWDADDWNHAAAVYDRLHRIIRGQHAEPSESLKKKQP